MGVVSAIAQVMRQNLCEKQSSPGSSNSLVPGTETILAMLQGPELVPLLCSPLRHALRGALLVHCS